MFLRQVIPGANSRLDIVDHRETYGRHILDKVLKDITVSRCLDIGFGTGVDLSSVKKHFPEAELFGLDINKNSDIPSSLNLQSFIIDIEKEKFPFPDNYFDLIIANQVFEHTKEIFWLNHETFRCLKTGGILFLGVPNLLSLHNRILMLFGFHPTSSKIISAHVRSFSRKDTEFFYRSIASSFCKIEKFYGSQFYPFPKIIARFLAGIFPGLAFSSFYIIRKTGQYNGEFLTWPKHAALETKFFLGEDNNS